MTETTERRRAADVQIAALHERMGNLEEMVVEIRDSIVGTLALKGSAGDLRDLKIWRQSLEGEPGSPDHVTLKEQLKEIRDWQANISTWFKWFVIPVTLTLLTGFIALVGMLLTHQAELIFKH